MHIPRPSRRTLKAVFDALWPLNDQAFNGFYEAIMAILTVPSQDDEDDVSLQSVLRGIKWFTDPQTIEFRQRPEEKTSKEEKKTG